jgi:hypothetical protein
MQNKVHLGHFLIFLVDDFVYRIGAVEAARKEAHGKVVEELFLFQEFTFEESIVLEKNISKNEITDHFFDNFFGQLTEIAAVSKIIDPVISGKILDITLDFRNE